jgi:hypothetical protein
MQKAKS